MQPEYIAPDKTQKNQRLFKAIIMAAIILITFGAGLGVGAIVFNADNKVTIDEEVVSYDDSGDYTPILKIYARLDEDMMMEELSELTEEIDYDATINIEGESGTINLPNNDSEYIYFDIEKGDEGESDIAYDIMYIYENDDLSMYIMQTGDNTYQHFNGEVTSEFATKEEAISNHLGQI